MSTYYDILEVSEDASQKEIKKAYREKVKETHPDQSDHPNAAQLFMQVQEANDILSDPQKREKYDNGTLGGRSHDTGTQHTQSTQARQTQSTAEADRDDVGWRSFTRGSDPAEQIWDQEVNTGEKPPTPDSISQSWLKSKAAHIGMATTGGAIGYLFADNFISAVFSITTDPWGTMNMGWVGFVVLILALVTSIGVFEVIVGTHRRIYKLS